MARIWTCDCKVLVEQNKLADIADQIERERECDADTIENLRLELGEAREAAAWVREHGGLDGVKELLDWVVGHRSTRQQLDFDFWLSGRVMHELGFEEDMADRDEVGRRLLARLMPEGMEWPTVDGKPVDFATGYEPSLGVLEAVCIYSNGACEVMGHDGIIKGVNEIHISAPKVLDAGGEEIRVKETVFDKNTGEELIVTGFEDGRVWCEHRMTDADALPVRGMWSPDQLTHERPDSWERLERDANVSTCTYFGATTKDCEICGHVSWECSYDKASDLVRRARALAERERGE